MALALANSEGLEQCQKQSRSVFRLWSSTIEPRAGLSFESVLRHRTYVR
jgi:hypothetical protein